MHNGKSQLSTHTPCPPPFTHTVSPSLQAGLKGTLLPSRSPSRQHMPPLLQEALPDARPALSRVEFRSATCSLVPWLDKEPRGSGWAGCCRGGENAPVLGLLRVQAACLRPVPLAASPDAHPAAPCLKGLLPPFQARCMSTSLQEKDGGCPTNSTPHGHPPEGCSSPTCACHMPGVGGGSPHPLPPMTTLTLISVLGPRHRTL